jgi:hypothetical protein
MPDKFVVFDVVEIQAVDEDDTRSPRERMTVTRSTKAPAAIRAIDVEFSTLSENFSGFVNNVRSMLAKVAAHESAFMVEKVEIQAEISGEGKVGFMGNGVKASGGASIKLILERRKEPGKDGEGS